MWKEGMLFNDYIILIIQNSNIEDIQNDTVNLYNILEPISYLCTIDYSSSSDLLIQELESCFRFFWETINWQDETTRPSEDDIIKHVKKSCWSIILTSEFIKKSQEQRNKIRKLCETNSLYGSSEHDSTLKINELLGCDILLCKSIFGISQIAGFSEEYNLRRSLMIFF